jgi:hypothetical protein
VTAVAVAPDAGQDATSPPADPRCAGSAIDLTAVLLDRLCGEATTSAGRVPAGALRFAISAPPRLAPGAEGIARVTLTNVTPGDVDLRVYLSGSAMFGSGPGAGFGFGPGAPPGAGPRAAPAPPRAVRAVRAVDVGQSTTSPDGKRSFDATWAELSALSPHVLVRLAPGGSAELHVTLRARGFLPGKDYAPSRYSIDSPPDPLPPGRYKVTPRLGIDADGADALVVDLEVRR